MIKSLNRAEHAMQLQQVRIDTLANNLANVNTAGFRQALTRAVQQGAEPAAGDPGDLTVPTADRVAAGRTAQQQPQLLRSLDTRRGGMQATGRDTDVAIMGQGFFVIQTEDGERFTRAGTFTLDDQRRLTTPSGEPVLGTGGPITVDGEKFAVAADGTIMVDGAAQGRLRVVDFDDPHRLSQFGENMLTAPADLAPRTLAAEETVVAQGFVEGSNVSAVDTLVAMIAAQRAFEVQSKVLTTEDEMLDKSVNQLSRVGQG